MKLNGRLNAAVESDVVGYTTVEMEGKGASAPIWYQIAIQFKGLGESEDKIKLGEAISITGLTPTTWRNKSNAPCIQVYNGVSYDLYYYTTQAFVDPTKTDTTKVTGWANANQVLVGDDTKIPAGVGFWIKTSGTETGTLTFSL